MEIQVSGKQWMWHIQHPNGRREVNTLTVPAGRPIKLRMWSQDVIHDFFIPDFRVKMDVLPGRITTLWFEADEKALARAGGQRSEHALFCAEFCGTEHSRMVGKVVVLSPEAYETWLQTGNSRDIMASTPEAAGEKLFSRLGCVGCHAAGDTQRGPKLAGIWESEVSLEGGASVTVNEDYIRESILNPTAKVVSGYPKLMPTFKGQVSDTDIFNLIKYIQSLKNEG
jgi:cytochrome c oxidase subunit 2